MSGPHSISQSPYEESLRFPGEEVVLSQTETSKPCLSFPPAGMPCRFKLQTAHQLLSDFLASLPYTFLFVCLFVFGLPTPDNLVSKLLKINLVLYHSLYPVGSVSLKNPAEYTIQTKCSALEDTNLKNGVVVLTSP